MGDMHDFKHEPKVFRNAKGHKNQCKVESVEVKLLEKTYLWFIEA